MEKKSIREIISTVFKALTWRTRLKDEPKS